jgi:hypothetical protein
MPVLLVGARGWAITRLCSPVACSCTAGADPRGGYSDGALERASIDLIIMALSGAPFGGLCPNSGLSATVFQPSRRRWVPHRHVQALQREHIFSTCIRQPRRETIFSNPEYEVLRLTLIPRADPASPARLPVYPRRDEGMMAWVFGVGKIWEKFLQKLKCDEDRAGQPIPYT